jgi:CRP/FNR family transcriptional regulator, cyclic AMP receptor protein
MRKVLYVLGILDDSDLEWLASNGRRLSLADGHVLIREGEPVDALFIVLDGGLDVTSGGKLVATLLSGEMVGEISFVDARPPSATVSASRSCTVLAIPRAILHARLNSDPWFASRFFRALATFLADRLRMTTARLGYGSAAQDAKPSNDADEIDLDMMDSASLAAVRFDRLLKRLGESSGIQ